MKTKKKILLIMLLSVLMVLASSVSVWAAKNPLSKMPRNVGSVASPVNVSVINKTSFCTEPLNVALVEMNPFDDIPSDAL